jgi:hypothetical protein
MELIYGVTIAIKDFSGSITVSFPYNLQLVANVKTTEIYIQVSTKSIGKIKSPLDSLNLKKEVICNKICKR